ncbi:MAG: methylmalonyl-CoA mutase [Lachnospiraceae bacterium]|nr:methylmalonyl-CoA mutase [Lachnospiraceae bacterium]
MQISLNKRFEYKALPDMKTLRARAEELCANITIGTTLFMKKHNVKSEAEFKKKCIETGYISKHSHIGYTTWEKTAEAMVKIYEELEKRGSTVDRFGICFDQNMGLPEEYRKGQIKGISLMFYSDEEWLQMGQIVPAQPHMGDMVLGTPNSIHNTVMSLRAGATTVGNATHYWCQEYPGLELEELRTIETTTSLMIMAHFADQGALIHSNVDDGFGGQMQDLANLAGFARIERYYMEELCGANMSHCFGNMFSNPISRIVFNLTMSDYAEQTHHAVGSLIYGNTVGYGFDIENNMGVLSSYAMADIIGQTYRPTGHSIAAVPVTEAMRIPNVDEIVQAHRIIDKMIEKAPYYAEHMDWEKIIAEKEVLKKGGELFFERVMNGLDDLGVNINHAGEIMAALKAIGPYQLEELFGVGEADKNALRGRRPLRPTDVVVDLKAKQKEIMDRIDDISGKLDGVKIVIASSDQHEFGKDLVKDVMLSAGASVFDLGFSVAPLEIAETLIETESKVLLISTHNGFAYSYAKEVIAEMERKKLKDVLFIMGGLLNENPEDGVLAVDVSDQLFKMGINVDNDIDTMADTIRDFIKFN